MNRNTEWEYFISRIKGSYPPQIEYSAQRAISRAKSRRRASLMVKIPSYSFVALFIIFAALENTSSGFSDATKKVPLLRLLARLVTIRHA